MRTLNVEEISKNIKEMCIEANPFKRYGHCDEKCSFNREVTTGEKDIKPASG